MKNIVCLLTVASVLTGCAPSALVPCMPNSPMLEKKYDGHLSAQGNFGHAELQGSFSPVNHLGLNFNSYVSPPKSLISNSTDQWQASAGYYYYHDDIGFDLFAGFGSGYRDCSSSYGYSFLPMGDASTNSAFNEYFVQADVYTRQGDKWKEALSLQWGQFVFSDFYYRNSVLIRHDHFDTYEYRLLSNRQAMFIVSATFDYRFSKRFSFFLQPGGRICSPLHDQVQTYSPGGSATGYYNDNSGFLDRLNTRLFISSGFVFHFQKKNELK